MYKKRGRKNVKPNKEIFEMIYYNKETKAEELAKSYKVNTQTIYNWAYEFRKTQNKAK